MFTPSKTGRGEAFCCQYCGVVDLQRRSKYRIRGLGTVEEWRDAAGSLRCADSKREHAATIRGPHGKGLGKTA